MYNLQKIVVYSFIWVEIKGPTQTPTCIRFGCDLTKSNLDEVDTGIINSEEAHVRDIYKLTLIVWIFCSRKHSVSKIFELVQFYNFAIVCLESPPRAFVYLESPQRANHQTQSWGINKRIWHAQINLCMELLCDTTRSFCAQLTSRLNN
jgi:hypothetical protein